MKFLWLLFLSPYIVHAVDFKKTDIFGFIGTTFIVSPRANYTVGIGRRFQFKCNPAKKVRWEVTGTYTYENNGNHGFLPARYAAHTEALGLVRTIHMPGRFISFAATHVGATEYSGQDKAAKAFINGTYGAGMHIHYRYTLSVNETYTKVQTKPTYWTTGVALTHGWWSVSANANRTSGDYRANLNLGISVSALMSGEHKEQPKMIQTTRGR